MSSPSTKQTENGRCPECNKGKLRRVLATRSFTIDNRRFRVSCLMPLECDFCGARVWPESELKRAEKVLELKQKTKAA